MTYQFTPYAIAQFVTAAVSILVTFMLWQRHSVRSGWQLFLLFIAISEWSLANGFEAAAVPQDLKIFWSKIAYLGAQTSPVFLLLFALTYTRRIQRMKNGIIVLFFIIPILVIISALTNDIHGLLWLGFSPGPPGTNSLIYHHGPVFWLSAAYIFSIVSFATTLLIVFAVRSQKIYRIQHSILILASISPWVGLVFYIFDIGPFSGLDTTTIGFLLTGILLIVGIFQGNMLSSIPIAHEMLFDNIKDGIIVVDDYQKIVDMNPAAQNQFSVRFDDVLNRSLDQTLMMPFFKKVKFSKEKNQRFEMKSFIDNRTWFDISIAPLRDKWDSNLGWVINTVDITERKKTEEKLQQVNQRLERQIKEIRLLENQLREAANRDSLTGVFNRGYLEETLKREIARAKRENYPLSVIMLDVDNFKTINDSYGHKMGDRVVVALGRLLEKSTREADCVSRYGGDEFVMVMPGMSKEYAYQRAEKWRNECKKLRLTKLEKDIHFTISIGIATCPLDGKSSETLLDNVDQALYSAKQAGRDCTHIAGEL